MGPGSSTGSRPAKSRSAPLAEPVLAQAPDEQVDAVLAEERLPLEDHGGHAPVPGRLEVALVLVDLGVERRRLARDRDVHLREVVPRARGGLGEVGALVPARGATPDETRHLVDEFEPALAPRGERAETH